MRKLSLVSLFCLSSFASLAMAVEVTTDVWDMPETLPGLPEGANPATHPMPRIDWVVRVAENNRKAHEAADSIQLVFDGDSITDFWTNRSGGLWEELYVPYGAVDFGISGDRTQHLLWRLEQGQLDGLDPKLVCLMIGTNNVPWPDTPEQIAEGVKAIVEQYRERCPNAVILLQAVFPRDAEPDTPRRQKIDALNALISKLGDGEKVIYVDFADDFLEPDGRLSPEIMPDALHPNEKGYEIWAKAIQPYIEKYVGPVPAAAAAH